MEKRRDLMWLKNCAEPKLGIYYVGTKCVCKEIRNHETYIFIMILPKPAGCLQDSKGNRNFSKKPARTRYTFLCAISAIK